MFAAYEYSKEMVAVVVRAVGSGAAASKHDAVIRRLWSTWTLRGLGLEGTALGKSSQQSCLCFCHSSLDVHILIACIVTMSGLLSSPSLSVPTLTIETSSSELKVRVGRTRSSSIVKVETVGENSQEEELDQSLYDNLNTEWVNRKGKYSLGLITPASLEQCAKTPRPESTGAWIIHPILIIAGKVVVDTIPGMRQEVSWTLTNLVYLGVRRRQLATLPAA